MSAFSAVDDSRDPRRLIRSLEYSAAGLAAMKHYMAVTHSLRQPSAPVLDLGCGAGHDLAVLEAFGLACVAVDPSMVMVIEAGARGASPVVRAWGHQLPFADRVFSGCWVERVLMHVVEPAAVIAEVVRCVRPGGLLTIFEPDWSALAVNGVRVPAEWVTGARHPAIGAAVGTLLTDAGCSIRDRVEERSWWTYDEFQRITNLEPSRDSCVTSGTGGRSGVETWLDAQQPFVADGTFRAEIAKILWVATTPP